MENIRTYVQQYGNQLIEDLPFGELDVLVLTEIFYVHFLQEDLPELLDSAKGKTISEVWQTIDSKLEDRIQLNPWVMTPERIELFQAVATSDRYHSIKMFGFVNDINRETTKQFAAVTYQITEGLRLIVYRGTDETLVGWKEDFMMTYSPTIPAQDAAAQYLKKQLEATTDRMILSGHSKGGNLAMYSASTQARTLQEQIEHVYGWDAPGLHHSVVESTGYQQMIPKAIRYIPQDSIVGVMLESSVPYKIVQSTSRGAGQHNVLTWIVEKNHFVELPELTRNSQLTDQLFKEWTKSISDEEFKIFWDSFFDLLFDMGLDTMNDIEGQYLYYIQRFMDHAGQMDKEKRELLIKVSSSLVQQSYLIWRNAIEINVTPPEIKLPSLEEMMKKLQRQENAFKIIYEYTDENEQIRKYYQLRHIQKKLEKMKQ